MLLWGSEHYERPNPTPRPATPQPTNPSARHVRSWGLFSAPPVPTPRPAAAGSPAAAPPRATPGRPALPQSPDPAPSPPPSRRSRPRPARRPRARSPTWRRGHERGGGWGGCGPGPHSGRAARPPGAIFARQARAAPPPHGASRAGPGTLSRPTPYGASVAVASPERGPGPPGRASQRRPGPCVPGALGASVRPSSRAPVRPAVGARPPAARPGRASGSRWGGGGDGPDRAGEGGGGKERGRERGGGGAGPRGGALST